MSDSTFIQVIFCYSTGEKLEPTLRVPITDRNIIIKELAFQAVKRLAGLHRCRGQDIVVSEVTVDNGAVLFPTDPLLSVVDPKTEKVHIVLGQVMEQFADRKNCVILAGQGQKHSQPERSMDLTRPDAMQAPAPVVMKPKTSPFIEPLPPRENDVSQDISATPCGQVVHKRPDTEKKDEMSEHKKRNVARGKAQKEAEDAAEEKKNAKAAEKAKSKSQNTVQPAKKPASAKAPAKAESLPRTPGGGVDEERCTEDQLLELRRKRGEAGWNEANVALFPANYCSNPDALLRAKKKARREAEKSLAESKTVAAKNTKNGATTAPAKNAAKASSASKTAGSGTKSAPLRLVSDDEVEDVTRELKFDAENTTPARQIPSARKGELGWNEKSLEYFSPNYCANPDKVGKLLANAADIQLPKRRSYLRGNLELREDQ